MITSEADQYETCSQQTTQALCSGSNACKWNFPGQYDATASYKCATKPGFASSDCDQQYIFALCNSKDSCEWKVSTDGTGVAISKKMDVCTHVPNFYDNQQVIDECKAITDKTACLNTGKCLYNDCTGQQDTTAAYVPTAVACSGTQQCNQFNGPGTPGVCLDMNYPALPISYEKNMCTH
jgi:hypothetical protein